MTCNVGGSDRVLRFAAGVVLLLLAGFVVETMFWRIVLLAIAAIALITGFVRYCPLNRAFGLNSCTPREITDSSGAAR